MADIELTYKGSVIGTLSASGTLTMETQGKYCEDDITLTYTSPGGGGGVTAATGEITIASDVASPGSQASNLFPGLQLSFKPDFLWIAKKRDSWMTEDQNASHGANLFIACRKTMIPPLRASGSSESDDSTNDYVFIYSSTSYAGTWVDGQITPNTGYGMAAITTLVQNPLDYGGPGTWSVNDDGTFSYGRGSNAAQITLKANSVYRYFAVKA